MTSIDDWHPWLAILFLSGPFALALGGIAYTWYLARYRLDEMMKALENSRYVYIWGASLKNQGLLGNELVMAKIAQIVLWPKSSLTIGELNPVDLQNFPPSLKRLLKIKLTIYIAACTWMVITFIVIELR